MLLFKHLYHPVRVIADDAVDTQLKQGADFLWLIHRPGNEEQVALMTSV